MLKERGYYLIELPEGNVPIRFCTWTFKRFCELKDNLKLSGLFELLSKEVTLSDIVLLMLCASEYECRVQGAKFTYTDIDASNWIDAMGGLGGEKFNEMIKAIAASTNYDSGEKPTDEKKMKVSSGNGSSTYVQKPG